MPALFLSTIDTIKNADNIDRAALAEVDSYLAEMAQGPADGEMDIQWQETCKGYYRHLYALGVIDDEDSKQEYLKELKIDIEQWLEREPGNCMVLSVRNQVFGY